MKLKTVKKTWNGLVTVRDYEVTDAIAKGGMVIKFNKEKMTLSPNKLIKGLEIITRMFFSKTGGKNYRLIDFKWQPDQPVGGLYGKEEESKETNTSRRLQEALQ